jgi:type I restriction enzyme R subunit
MPAEPVVLRIPPLNTLGTPVELIKAFGGKDAFEWAVLELQSALYSDVA